MLDAPMNHYLERLIYLLKESWQSRTDFCKFLSVVFGCFSFENPSHFVRYHVNLANFVKRRKYFYYTARLITFSLSIFPKTS